MRDARRSTVAVASLAAALAALAGAETYQVGPTRPFTSLQDVAGLLQPGDVVEVDGDHTYPGGVVFTQPGTEAQPITIRGVRVNDSRPTLAGGTNTVQFATPWPYAPPGADWYVLEGFELTGGSSRCLYHQAGDLVVRDVLVRDCPAHGILGADQGSGSLTLEHVEVHGCGEGTQRHQIYMATDEVNRPGSVFRMRHCYIHDGVGGNNVKSRAERNEIHFNWIEGAHYHELELIGPDPGGAPAGWTPELAREDSDVVGNVLWKKGANDTFFVTRIGGDATGESDGRYRFVNNTFICGTSAAFRIFDGIESVQMHNNVFETNHEDGPQIVRTVEAIWATGAEVIAGSTNWVKTGATSVPAQWTGTLTGAAPGFADFVGENVRPAPGSPLLAAGTVTPADPPGYPFPDPLFPPSWHPPDGAIQNLGAAWPRPVGSTIDVGAFETSCLFADGLEGGTTLSWSSSG